MFGISELSESWLQFGISEPSESLAAGRTHPSSCAGGEEHCCVQEGKRSKHGGRARKGLPKFLDVLRVDKERGTLLNSQDG